MKVFVTGTGTGIGKTWLAAGLIRRLRERGRRVAGLKPVETGCDPVAADALVLAQAAGRPELANALGFHRGRLPLAPWSATLAGDTPPPALEPLATAIEAASNGADDVVVEGAGGLLVPYDATHDFADLAARLGLALLLVAPNRLGTLSHVLTAAESASRRELRIAAIALTEPTPEPDLSAASNARVLQDRLRIPVLAFDHRPTPDSVGLDRLLAIIDREYHL